MHSEKINEPQILSDSSLFTEEEDINQLNNQNKEGEIISETENISSQSEPPFSPGKIKLQNESILEKYDFDWDMIDVIIGGKSSIDLSRLIIDNVEDAGTFIYIYGYDLNKKEVRKEVLEIFQEAVNFIEKELIPDPVSKEIKLKVPEAIKKETDLRKLLVIASDYSNELQPWACAALRVMHTIAHVNNDFSHKFFPEIQKQILDRIWSAIYINHEGKKYFGDDSNGVPIYDVEIKAKKERNSTILKLLHKSENVASDIFDKIGVRIITYNKIDALLIVRFLRKNRVLDFCNVKPSRSINRLIDLKVFKKMLNYYKDKFTRGEIDSETFENILRQEVERDAKLIDENIEETVNPHTSKEYRSIQFTCRQLIRMQYPDSESCPEIKDIESEKFSFNFFFPYEMQVVDIQTYLENNYGKASHEKYKEKQLKRARIRVLGKLLRQ